MRKFVASCEQAFLLLRRDHLSVPFIAGTCATVIFAFTASEWTIEDFEKVLMDLTAFGLHIFGGIVTILWGTRLFSTFSDENPAIEFELAAPVSRSSWLLSRFTGFGLYLVALGILFFLTWFAMFRLNGLNFFSWKILWMFAAQVTGWLSLAALTCFVGSFCRRSAALFITFSLWVCGLVAPLSLTESPVKGMAGWLATFWNFQLFNIVPENVQGAGEVVLTLIYGLGLWTVLLSLACLIFSRRKIYV